MFDSLELGEKFKNFYQDNKLLSWSIIIGIVVFVALLLSPYYVMFIVGTSMDPEIEHHDILVASEARQPDIGDNVDVQIENDSVPYDIVHEVVMVNSTHIQTKGINRSHRDPPSRRENIDGEIIYVLSPPDYVKELYKPFIPNTYEELEEQYS